MQIGSVHDTNFTKIQNFFKNNQKLAKLDTFWTNPFDNEDLFL